jgi:hypothetical protein
MIEKERSREKTNGIRMEIPKTRRKSRYMDKRICQRVLASTYGSKRRDGESNTKESAGTILVWKEGDKWVIYDQLEDVVTEGYTYQDAIFMLSDALKELGKGNE